MIAFLKLINKLNVLKIKHLTFNTIVSFKDREIYKRCIF